MTKIQKLSPWTALGIAFAGQAAVLAYMIYDRVMLLRTGREIVLDVTPVDPRSLFRGDYVVLSYPAALLGDDLRKSLPKGDIGPDLYLVLGRNGDGKWRAKACSIERPKNVAAEDVVVKGRLPSTSFARSVQLGIESYFVPEGKGRSVEAAVAKQEVEVRVAVGSDGRTAIKGLLIGGKSFDEPLL